MDEADNSVKDDTIELWHLKLKQACCSSDITDLEPYFDEVINRIEKLKEPSSHPLYLDILLNYAAIKRKSNDIKMAEVLYDTAKKHFKKCADLYILWVDMLDKSGCTSGSSIRDILFCAKKSKAVPTETVTKACSNFLNKIPICNGIDLPAMWPTYDTEMRTNSILDNENTPQIPRSRPTDLENKENNNQRCLSTTQKKGFTNAKSHQSFSTSELLMPRRNITKKRMEKGHTISFDRAVIQPPFRSLFGTTDEKRFNSVKKQPRSTSKNTLSCSKSTSRLERNRYQNDDNNSFSIEGIIPLDHNIVTQIEKQTLDNIPAFSISTRQCSMSSSSSSSSDGSSHLTGNTKEVNNSSTNTVHTINTNKSSAKQELFKTPSQNAVCCKQNSIKSSRKQINQDNSYTSVLTSDNDSIQKDLEIIQQFTMPDIQPSTSKMIYVNGKGYLKMKLIGKGGSAKVYEILNQERKSMALKCVSLEGIDNFLLKSYIKEIEILTKLRNCQYVIDLYDWEIRNEELFMVMEKGEQDLSKFLKSNKNISINKIKSIWKMILMAVQSIHDLGIIHSDIKPANFMYVQSQLKLIDFGIARSLQANMTSITLAENLGTVNYMAPESLAGVNPDTRTKSTRVNRALDVWSLACVLYYMVYKRLPYQQITNNIMKVEAICRGQTIEFPPFEDESIVDAMKGCLKTRPEERFSIDELLSHPSLRQIDIEECTPQVTKQPTRTDMKNCISKIVSKISSSPITAERIMSLAI